jgi:hypothetical protein
MAASINPPNTPIVGNLPVTPEWYRYFVRITKGSNLASEGEVATPPDGGLEGGGLVSGGVTLSIAANGVSNAMLRQSVGTSVVGRMANTAGNVADISAVQDRTVLARQGGLLAFTPVCAVLGLAVNVTAVTTTYTAIATDYLVTADATGGAFTVTLPALAGMLGRVVIVKKIDASANTVTVDGGAANIDGAATRALATQYAAIWVLAGTSEWHVL